MPLRLRVILFTVDVTIIAVIDFSLSTSVVRGLLNYNPVGKWIGLGIVQKF